MNIRLFKSKMALNGDNNATIAVFLGITPQTSSAKLHGTRGAEFSQSEISQLKERWNLTPEDVVAIFLAN